MGKYRVPSEKSKYYIPKADYMTAIYYSKRYPIWKQEMEARANTSGAIDYSKDKVQTSNDYDSTFEAAVILTDSDIAKKIKLIDDTIAKVANGLDYYLRLGVCYGFTFEQLKGKKMPCERDTYYTMRRHYYYELNKKI